MQYVTTVELKKGNSKIEVVSNAFNNISEAEGLAESILANFNRSEDVSINVGIKLVEPGYDY